MDVIRRHGMPFPTGHLDLCCIASQSILACVNTADSVLAMPKTLEHSVDIAAPADRVWDLVSTGEGLSGWFANATVAPGLQGSVTLRFAPGAEATVPILVWDPPRRIRFGMADGGRVHDIAVSAGAEGCQVRLHDEGVPDAEADATATGWAGFLGKLKALAESGR
jgi:uncharacterized protein YndB with AHSA1/START domain